MELQTAIEILEYHQEWRLGKREDMIHEPKKLTEALDIVLSEVKKFRLGDVSRRSEQLKAFYHYVDMEWANGSLTDKVDDVIDGFKKSF